MRSSLLLFRPCLAFLVTLALALGISLADPVASASNPPNSDILAAIPHQASQASASGTGSIAESSQPSMAASASLRNAYVAHAPLALFSAGSLAVGGIFYSLQNGLDRPRAGYAGRDGSAVGSAVAFAGVTALIAGASYFYYSHRDAERSRAWNAQVSGSLSPKGGMDLSAALTLSLPALP